MTWGLLSCPTWQSLHIQTSTRPSVGSLHSRNLVGLHDHHRTERDFGFRNLGQERPAHNDALCRISDNGPLGIVSFHSLRWVLVIFSFDRLRVSGARVLCCVSFAVLLELVRFVAGRFWLCEKRMEVTMLDG